MIPLGCISARFRRAEIMPNDLGIDLTFAHPAGDDLSVLRTEIENENAGMRRFFTGGSLRICLRRRGFSGAPRGTTWPLAGKSAFKLLAHFLGGGVFSAHPNMLTRRARKTRGFIWRCK